MHNKYINKIPMRDFQTAQQPMAQYHSYSRNRRPKGCRSVDNSLERETIADHFSIPYSNGNPIINESEENSTCKFILLNM